MNSILIRSKAAIARLRAYKPPPFPVWDKLPASRRAAVLLLLYADRRGDLRVVITMRAASLRSFSGTLRATSITTGDPLAVSADHDLLGQGMLHFQEERRIALKRRHVRDPWETQTPPTRRSPDLT
jgi:hypothetical protein